MIKLVIFDLDGTLLNTINDLADSTNFALSKFGYPTRSVGEIKSFVGNGVSKLFERAGVTDLECIKTFKEHYAKNMYNKTKPYADILSLLEKLKQNEIKIAVVSNKFDSAVKKLCAKYFTAVDIAFGENEAQGIRKKPSPESVFAILKHFNYEPCDAVFVGDSEVDIQTAKNAGIPCISVTWGFKTRDFLVKHGAEIIIDKPEQILTVVNSKKFS